MQMHELIALLRGPGPTLTNSDVERFEHRIGHRLPDEYRHLLLTCNGGWVDADLVFAPDTANECGLGAFYHLNDDPDTKGPWLLWVMLMMDARVPDDLLPIGCDLGGSHFCIGVGQHYLGRVYFFDCEEEFTEDNWDGRVETVEHIRFLANSLTEFVEGLQVIEG